MTNTNWIIAYYEQIQNGTVNVGKWVRMIYAYLVKGLEEERFFYNEKKANRAINFIEKFCHHTEGPLAPGLIQLELWQKALTAAIFGVVNDRGLRQFTEILLIVARKNGKSLYVAALMTYEFLVDGGYGARVYNIAPKLDQAEILYNNVWRNIQLEPELNALARHRMSDLYCESTNSTVKKIAMNSRKSDGFNPSLAACDEISSWPGDKGLKQYEVMKSGMGARPEPLLISCTTAGYENEGIYDELYKRATRMLNGESKEKHLLPVIYQIDDVEKWNDMEELKKANPNLGVSVSYDFLEQEIDVADGSFSKKAEFLTKYCNIKQNSTQAWLTTQTINKCCKEPINPENFRNSYCVAGIDLSKTTDLTAACVAIEKDGILNVLCHFWMPTTKLEEATIRDNLPYSAYIQRGILSLSGTNQIDYTDCYNWICDLYDTYDIIPMQIGYDRYCAQYLIRDLQARGFQCDDVNQGYNLTQVLQEMEGLLKDGRINIGDNDLLKVHLLDSALQQDTLQGKSRLVKINPSTSCHIDGTAALSDAICVRQKWYDIIGEPLKNED